MPIKEKYMARWPFLAATMLAAACTMNAADRQAGVAPPAQPSAGPALHGAAKVDAALLATGGDGSDWPAVGFSYLEQHYSPLTAINDGNVSQLGIAWSADLPDARGIEATPVVIDGVLYQSGPWSKVWAFDAVTGAKLWEFDPEVPKEKLVEACCDAVNRGVAVWKGKVYLGTLDGRLIALDATDGKQLWSTQTVDPAKPYSITGAPRVVKDMVIIGNGGAEFGVRGYVTAYDSTTGAKKWRFYTVPNPTGAADNEPSDAILKTAAASWSSGGAWKQSGGGGTVWDAIVYDPELDLLYLGVGNGSPWNYELRSEGKGDNLFLGSVVAIRPETGDYVWHYQETPQDNWDFTSTQPIVLATVTIGGQPRKVLLHAPKNGYVFVIDRTNGKLISADPFVEGINWASGYGPDGRPIFNPAAYYGAKDGKFFVGMPGAMGAHSWHPMAFSPKSGLLYIPANLAGLPYGPPSGNKDRTAMALGFNVGLDWGAGALPRDPNMIKAAIAATKGALIAWDPVARKEAWRIPYGTPWNGGALATAGNLLFQGSAVGNFQAFAADTGKPLFSLPVQSGVLAAPATYTVKGEQYIAFATSRGGVFALAPGKVGGAYNRVPNVPRLIVLKIGGKAQLPPLPASEPMVLNPPRSSGTKAQIASGLSLYSRYCSVCHGDSATSGGVNPDLRMSGLLGDAAAWKSVVIDGALRENGMVSFASVLSPSEAQSIRHYVIDQANWDKNVWQKAERAGGGGGN
ncbi:MAG: alcohol dehydrogenase [Sphingomonas bacterium]|nr:alcohol dehydrogenase [Sphingomonas bacterium]